MLPTLALMGTDSPVTHKSGEPGSGAISISWGGIGVGVGVGLGVGVGVAVGVEVGVGVGVAVGVGVGDGVAVGVGDGVMVGVAVGTGVAVGVGVGVAVAVGVAVGVGVGVAVGYIAGVSMTGCGVVTWPTIFPLVGSFVPINTNTAPSADARTILCVASSSKRGHPFRKGPETRRTVARDARPRFAPKCPTPS